MELENSKLNKNAEDSLKETFTINDEIQKRIVNSNLSKATPQNSDEIQKLREIEYEKFEKEKKIFYEKKAVIKF